MDAEPWQLATEVLIGCVSRLVDERDEIEQRLSDAQFDLEVARATIDELVHLNAVLQIELLRKKGKGSKENVGRAALVIATLASGFIGGMGSGAGTEAWKALQGVHDKAAVVIVECGVAEGQSRFGIPTVTQDEVPSKAVGPPPTVTAEDGPPGPTGPIGATPPTDNGVDKPLGPKSPDYQGGYGGSSYGGGGNG